MPTTTRVERICIDSDDADQTMTAYEEDADLFVNLRKGGIIRSGDCMGAIVVKLRVDEEPTHEILLSAYQPLGRRIDVLDMAIEQITIRTLCSASKMARTRGVVRAAPSCATCKDVGKLGVRRLPCRRVRCGADPAAGLCRDAACFGCDDQAPKDSRGSRDLGGGQVQRHNASPLAASRSCSW